MKQHNAIFILIFLVIVQFAQPGYAAEPLGRRIVLDNGMVLLLSEKHDLPMVTINMAIHAGSMVEPADKRDWHQSPRRSLCRGRPNARRPGSAVKLILSEVPFRSRRR